MSETSRCGLVFWWTAFVEPRPPQRVACREAEARARDHPYLMDDDDELPEADVLATECRDQLEDHVRWSVHSGYALKRCVGWA